MASNLLAFLLLGRMRLAAMPGAPSSVPKCQPNSNGLYKFQGKLLEDTVLTGLDDFSTEGRNVPRFVLFEAELFVTRVLYAWGSPECPLLLVASDRY